MPNDTTLLTDPLGKALLDFQGGNAHVEIRVESDKAEPESLPASYFFRSLANMPELEQLALKACTGCILDVGAGAGAHALELQKTALEVVALDQSAGAVSVMKERGIKQPVQGDFFALKDQQYDTLLLLMNGLGIAGRINNLTAFFKQCAQLLKPNGQILVDSSDLLHLYESDEDGYLIDLAGGYYGEFNYTMEYAGEQASFPWLFLDYASLEEEAQEAGFDCALIFEGEQGNYLAKLTRH